MGNRASTLAVEVVPACGGAPRDTLALRAVNECEASAMLPLECQYLNKSALTTLAGPLTPPVKHFQLKRKPKSATLRAELLQKCECRASVCPGLGGAGGARGLCPLGLGRPARPGLGGPAGFRRLAAGSRAFCPTSVVLF